jgi:hypothetical protein
MKRCSGCGKQIRSGSMIFASDGKGGIARKRVGPCCSSRAVPLLVGSIEASRCKCGAPASTCVACVRDEEKADPKKRFAKAIEKLRSIAKVYGNSGRQLGIEQAADILEAGDF